MEEETGRGLVFAALIIRSRSSLGLGRVIIDSIDNFPGYSFTPLVIAII
jgi:hypothetical protein